MIKSRSNEQYNAWTEEEEEIVRKLVKAGCSLDEMEKVILSRNRRAIAAWCYRQGYEIPAHKFKPSIDYEQFKKLVNQDIKEI